MAIKNQEAFSTCRRRARVLVKVLNPIETNPIVYLSNIREIDDLFG